MGNVIVQALSSWGARQQLMPLLTPLLRVYGFLSLCPSVFYLFHLCFYVHAYNYCKEAQGWSMV